MSQTIDSKVVEMKFDNSQFEGNVKTSINTLADLKSALNMDGVSDGLANISDAAKKVDVSSIGDGIDEVQVHFSALEVMATTVLANITNSAVNAAKSLTSSVIGMVFEGGWTRSANIEQAQFQLEGLGMDVEEVMANANEAVKGTAYGLDSAAKAAAMFGASGMEAGDQMTSSLRAIAGVAAMTGDSYDNIANIFTTVAGNGKLMTIQLRELANRGLNAAATLADYLGVTESEVREMVSNGEIDFQTFSDAMDSAFGEHAKDANKTFSGALSNMKAALARFGADVCTPLRDNLRDVFNGVIPVIDNIHEAAGPVIDGLSNLFGALASKILDVFEVFDGTGMSKFFEYVGNGIDKLATAINNFDIKGFIEKFKMSDETISNLQSTLKGLVSFLDLVRQAFGFVISVVGELLTFLAPVGSAILNVTGKFGDWITRIDQMAKENEVFATASEKVIGALEKVKEGFRNFRERVAEKFDLSSFDDLGGAFDKVKEKMSPVTTALKNFKETIGSACKSAWASVKDNFSPIIDKFKEFGNNIKETFQNFKANGDGSFMSFLSTMGTVFTNGLAAIIENVGSGITKFIQALGNFDFSGITGLLSSIGLSEIWINLGQISNSFKNMFSSLTSGGGEKANSILSQLKGILSQYQKELRAATLIMIAAAIAILAGALVEISNIEEGRLASSLAGIGTLFGELVGACALINKINFTSSLKSMSSLVILSRAIKNLASACVELGQLDWGGIARGLTGIGGLFAELYAFMYGLQKLSFKNVNVFGITVDLVILAEAIKMLSKSVETFGSMSWNDLVKGLTGVGGLIAELYGFLAGASSLTKSKDSYNMIGLASSIVILATGIKILQSAVTALGGLSWEELARGLVGVTALVAEIIVFLEAVSRLEKTESSYNLIGVASSIVILATGIKILQSAVTKLSGLSWNELAKGLSGVGGLLLELGVFLKAVSSLTKGEGGYNLIGVASSIVILASGIKILQSAVIKFSGLSWEEMAKGLLTLAGVLTEVVLAFNFIKTDGIMKTASAMLVLSTACLIFAPAMKILGSLSWESIAKGLITLAGAFTIIGVAGFALSGLSGIILALSASLLIIGVAADALALALVIAGAGLVTISAGLTSFATAMAISGSEIVAGISAIILGVVALVPEIINGFINGVLSVWDTITNFIIEIVHMLIDVIKETVPDLVQGILEVILEVCQSLAEYAPQIIDALMVLVEGVVDALIDKMPEIISKLKELVNEIFNAIFEDMDTKGLLELVVSIGLLAYIISKISDLKINLASAAKTIAELGILMAELAGVLALIGQLTRIPGLEDGIDRAASMLEGVGNAIGSLIGGLIGGIMTGIADDLPQIAEDLSEFMEALQPFIEGASNIDAGIAQSISSLAGAILAITAAEVIEGIASWFTGGSSIVKFGEELAEFGPYFAQYADSIDGIDTDAITASSAAAESIAAFAKAIPNEGGLLAKLVGDNSLEQFGEELASFGPHFADYANSITGIDTDAVTASAAAAESLSAFADTIGNSGGLISKIVGDNSLEQFGEELASFGPHFADYANSITGIDTDAVTASAAAAESLSAFANSIGNKGGLISKIVGDNSLEQFGKELAKFGPNFRTYANSVKGVDPDTITASAAAAGSLAEFADSIGNRGGVIALLAGDNSMALFGAELASFGGYFATYANAISGVDMNVVTASAAAAESLAAFANSLPTEGGFLEFFTGGTISLSDFGEELAAFAPYISSYASNLSGIDDSTVSTSEALVNVLSALTSVNLPTEGGVVSWFKGSEISLSEFGEQLPELADCLSEFAEKAAGIPEGADEGAQTIVDILAALTSVNLPTEGGIASWFKGNEISLSDFGDQLSSFVPGFQSFAEAVTEIPSEAISGAQTVVDILVALLGVDLPTTGGIFSLFKGKDVSLSAFGDELPQLAEDISTFADAASGIDANAGNNAKTIAEIISEFASIDMPSSGGLLSLFNGGDVSLKKFAKQLNDFAPDIVSFSNTIGEVDSGNIDSSIDAIATVIYVSQLIVDIPDISNVGDFGDNIVLFGNSLEKFSKCKIDSSKISSTVSSIEELADTLSNVANADISGVSSFSSDLEKIGKSGIDGFISAIDGSSSKVKSSIESLLKTAINAINNQKGTFKSAGASLMTNMINGIKGNSSSVKSAFTSGLSSAVSSVRSYYSSFYSAGQYLCTGLANGIKANSSSVSSAAKSVASAATSAAKRTLQVSSPSKVGYEIGDFFGIGFVNGIANNIKRAFNVSTEMAESGITALSSAVSKITDFIDSNMDVTPTITPVLDLSNVRSGLNSMNGLFAQNRGLAFAADNASFIADSMNRRNIQNDHMGDMLKAIKDLNKHMTNLSGDTYNVNGVTYDDGSTVSNAVNDLVHAIKVGRRI